MIRPGKYYTKANIQASIDELTTVRNLEKRDMTLLGSMVQNAVVSLLIREYPDMEFMELWEKARGRVIALGRINDIWKEPIWDWKTGKLLSANSGGNWSLHDNFNIPPDSNLIVDTKSSD